MMKIEKGQPGYVNAQKTKYLIWAVGEFLVVIALVVLGYIQTGSKLNLFTIAAVVCCLPAAKMLVEFITMAPHKSIEPERFEEIQEKAPLLTKIYDTVLTSKDKVMPVDVFVISGRTVCGYTKSPKTDEAKTAKYVKEMLQQNKCEKVTVKIFHDYTAFMARVEGMNNIASVDQPENRKREHKIKSLILSTSI
ncbi:MAG TPA: hypothetical protein H9873_01890 [Candidatus Dorea gallistercoris]|uniref:Uncharacterized protein n=1 Tax=Candidatus Dorea gallistercoris TaxID=2838542 RepID=A0A9D1R8R7_9FIRM|nr:hypothetical protein [Candidatus Dorea gallistercoris]